METQNTHWKWQTSETRSRVNCIYIDQLFWSVFPLTLHLFDLSFCSNVWFLSSSNGRMTHKMNTYLYWLNWTYISVSLSPSFEIVHGYMRNKLYSSLIFFFFGNVSARTSRFISKVSILAFDYLALLRCLLVTVITKNNQRN